MVEAMGGKCAICLYSKCSDALEFHHLDPNEKEFGFGRLKSWDVVCEELKKCVLLCSNCHREVHAGVVNIPENFARFDEAYCDYRGLRKERKVCVQCATILSDGRRKYCSVECASKAI